jgi:hypothetical protein
MSGHDFKERSPYKCYQLNGILYIPTYEDGGIYTAPNNKKYTPRDLMVVDAKEVIEYLWDFKDTANGGRYQHSLTNKNKHESKNES